MRLQAILTTAFCISLCSLTASMNAAASDYADAYYAKNFISPSGNIVCQGDGITDEDYPKQGVRCFIFKHKDTPRYTKDAQDCPLDWIPSYAVMNKGRGEYTGFCHGDVFWKPDSPKLGYGKTIKGDGWQCTSQKTGMRCTNRQGHGFHLSQANQKAW
ncbi:MAG: hypothetical protein Q4B81_07730 [Moraxella sp.]|nr:hypothetical protein [Moraxella sp.]